MKTVDRNIKDLIPAEYNPRFITEDALEQLKASIKRFDAVEPVIVNMHPDRKNIIISGHQRIKAAQSLGMKTFPCVELKLDKEQERELNIRMNKNTGAWDWDELANHFDVNELTDWGFNEDELFGNFESEEFEAEEDDYEIPDEIKTDIVLGDLIEIGEHRLLCGDSTDSDQVEKLMDGEKADMVFTDPPYNVNYESESTGKIKNDNMSDEDFEQFIRDVYKNIYLFTCENSAIYICHATMVIAFDTVLREFDWRVSNKIIWVKDIPTYSMAQYKWQYEPIYFVVKGRPEFYGDRTQTNIWNIKAIQSAGSHDDAGNSWFKGGSKGLTLHPTQKPIDVPSKAINNSSKLNNIVVDLFLGSGSTMVACQQLNRKCYGMELDPKYCQVIIDRMLNSFPDIEVKINGKPYQKK